MRRPIATREFVVLAGIVTLTLGAAVLATPSSATMAAAATKFLGSLSPEQRAQAAFPFAGDERTHWHFVPTETFPRNGLTIKSMSEAQRKLAYDLLKEGLSQRGYLTATQIMDLENVLSAVEAAQRAAAAQPPRNTPIARDPERYFFSVFGTPSTKDTWGWRVEGHHLSVHFTVVNGALIASSPSFFGTNPAEVRDGPKKGLRILALQEDAARALVEALTPEQRTQAVITETAPNDIVTMANVQVSPLSPTGIVATSLTAAQRRLLMDLIRAYTGQMAADIAADRMARVDKAGLDAITFAWAGTLERGQRHYYRVQGPTFLIEYDNTQNNANHIHSVWRDFAGDFGADLLREHVRNVPHND